MHLIARYTGLLLFFLLVPFSFLFADENQQKTLKIMSWNLYFLYDEIDDANKFPKTRYHRSDQDFKKLREIFNQLNPDIAGFQEIENLSALYKVVDQTRYTCAASKIKASVQEVGLCWKNSFPAPKITLLKYLQTNSRLRPGIQGKFHLSDKSITITNVHFKAGKPDLAKSKQQTVRNLQFTRLFQNLSPHNQIIIGDFNYNLRKDPARVLSPENRLSIAGKNNIPRCWQYKRFFIDYILYSSGFTEKSFAQIQYANDDGKFDGNPETEKGLSDHCPIIAVLQY